MTASASRISVIFQPHLGCCTPLSGTASGRISANSAQYSTPVRNIGVNKPIQSHWKRRNGYVQSVSRQRAQHESRQLTICRRIRGASFRFVVGSQREEFTIPQSLLKGLSEPLYRMMTNGTPQESIHGTAELSEVDPDTFAEFLEYAYSRDYRQPLCKIPTGLLTKRCRRVEVPREFYCRGWCCRQEDLAIPFTRHSNQGHYPFCGVFCKNAAALEFQVDTFCVGCDTAFAQARHQDILPYYCTQCLERSIIQDCDPRDMDLVKHDLQHINKFSEVFRHVETYLKQAAPLSSSPKPLIDHAKMFVFADLYMVDAMKPLALCEMYRQLALLTVDDGNIGQLVDLVRYTYANTGAYDDSADHLTSSADKLVQKEDKYNIETMSLRSLVRIHVTDRLKVLAKYEAFRQLFAEGGDLATDVLVDMTELLL